MSKSFVVIAPKESAISTVTTYFCALSTSNGLIVNFPVDFEKATKAGRVVFPFSYDLIVIGYPSLSLKLGKVVSAIEFYVTDADSRAPSN